MDIKSVKEKIEKGQWQNEIPPELRQKSKKIEAKPKRTSLKDKLTRKKH